ncbi:hypothetical protein MKW98_014064 [Papaver atlanticum]|uniref:Thaumatin-like protein n=1 Tax=Papaver atlanticum TaxID=357466 RepID=A0AAD4SIR7_9MAGN|nr:hypothetical protein MKW98_014064 [Papaver atlanticum]
MKAPTSLIFFPILFFSLLSFTAITQTATFTIVNRCNYPVWAVVVPGGGRRLEMNHAWKINVAVGTTGASIWGRTNCKFDGSGRGNVKHGDCNGLLLCNSYGQLQNTCYGQPPNTLVEYALNQWNNLNFFDIFLIDGFNVPMDFSPTGSFRGIICSANINGKCSNELRVPGGCNNPYTTFRTDQYCCNSGNCGPTYFSRFFKDRC